MITAQEPIFFLPNRVWRCYTGGALLEQFIGKNSDPDGHFPEDWLASCVRAINGPNSQGADEGLSRILLEDGTAGPLLSDVLHADPIAYLGNDLQDGLGILCKYLDSAVRLPIQCHPDRDFARKYYQSEHGKAEAWIVLATREIDGVEPYLLMGFQPGIRAEEFSTAVYRQDIAAMETMLHRVPVKPGEVYFIPGRFPHAIGSGVLILEVQEPSDWVVQPEERCADTQLTPADMWGPLTPQLGLACFNYLGETLEAVMQRCRKVATPLNATTGGTLSQLIGPDTTDCFAVHQLTVTGEYALTDFRPCYLAVVADGEGTLEWGDGASRHLRCGDVFLVPYGVSSIRLRAQTERLSLYLCSR